MTRRHSLLVDLQAAQSPGHWDRGIARYTKEHARALTRRGLVDGLLLNPNLSFPRSLDRDLLASPLLRWNTLSEVRSLLDGDDRPPAYLVSSPFEISAWDEGDVPPHLFRGDVAVAVTLYDLIPLVMADRYLTKPDYAKRYRARVELLQQVDLLLTISEHARSDALRLLEVDPAKVVAVGTGVSAFFRPAGERDDPAALLVRAVPAIDRPYALYVSGDDLRKNTEGLIEAWGLLPAAIRRDHLLVIACKVDDATRARWEALGRAHGLADGDLVITGFVSDEALRALYQRCRLAVVPALYEGFGMPVSEAIACGAPVVSSSTSSLPEVLDLVESTFDPADPAAIATVVERGLVDDDFRSRLLARGVARRPALSWDAVAARSEAALARLPVPPLRFAQRRPRIALVGPMPPETSGIADYNARLLPELASRAEVDVYCSSRRPGLVPHGVGWYPVAALDRNRSPWSYDAVVYTVGNSDHHHRLYEVARRFPGVLWLHDARLPGLVTTWALAGELDDHDGRTHLGDRLARQYDRRLPRPFLVDPAQPLEEFGAQGLGMTGELVGLARSVVVSSALAQRLVALDQMPDARLPPVAVLPLAFPPPWGDDARRHPDSSPLLACFGVVAPVKGAELLVQALATVRDGGIDARLALVGPVDDGYRQHLEGLAEQVGVTGALTLTGRVDDDAYRRWLEEATVAVQLRLGTNGEASAALTDCLAAGVPTLTNVAADVPTGAAQVLPWDADAVVVATEIAALLATPARRRELSEAGRATAASWGFGHVAAGLLDHIRRC